jgi:hypothetical protein
MIRLGILIFNTGNLSLLLGIALIALCLLGFFAVYYIMRKKILEDTQLDRMIELGKWVVVSVSIVVVAAIVSDGFKEREQQMKELEYFDKYKDITLSINGVQQKWLLADYFATVSPEGQFKRSWEAYREKIKPDHQKSDTLIQLQIKLDQAKSALSTIKDTTLRDQLYAVNARAMDSVSALKAMIEYKYQPILNAPQSALTGYKIDVFYTQDIEAESKPRAQKIYNLLLQKYPDCTISIRVLSKAANAQSGYSVQQNEIRYEQSEKEAFNELQNVINNAGILEKEQAVGHIVRNYTPNYISVFVRNM